MSLSGGLSCGLGRLLGGPTRPVLPGGGTSATDDAVYRDSSSRGLFGLGGVKVVSF